MDSVICAPPKKRSYILVIFFNKPSRLVQLTLQDTKHPLKKFGSLLVGTRKIYNALCMHSLFLFTEKYYCRQKKTTSYICELLAFEVCRGISAVESMLSCPANQQLVIKRLYLGMGCSVLGSGSMKTSSFIFIAYPHGEMGVGSPRGWPSGTHKLSRPTACGTGVHPKKQLA